MKKPFFFRIETVDLLDFATEPEGEGMTLLRFAKELHKGESDIPFIQKIINEAHSFKKKKKDAGKLGGNKKWEKLNSDRNKYGSTRSERLSHARTLATHTDEEWEALKKVTDYKCVICGCNIEENSPTKDHIIPISAGGSDGIDNIQPTCRQCNSRKTDSIDSRPSNWSEMVSKCLAENSKCIARNRSSNSKEETPPISPKGEDLFSKFWQAYPRKVGKGAAEKSWKKIKQPSLTLNEILEALKWQVASDLWAKDNGQYIPNPSTYLNQQRWKDEPPKKKAKGEGRSWMDAY